MFFVVGQEVLRSFCYFNVLLGQTLAVIPWLINDSNTIPRLIIYNFGLTTFQHLPTAPIKVVEALDDAFKRLEFSAEQVVYLFEKIVSYISKKQWNQEGIDEETQDNFMKLFKAEIVYRRNQLSKEILPKPEVKKLRQDLKTILQSELQRFPEYLEGLEPKEKLNFICKLMPFVMPKVNSIHFEKGESEYGENSFWQ